MNYIARLTLERNEARDALVTAEAELNELLAYLGSSKFSGDGDYVHIRTDLMPKLLSLRMTMGEGR